MWTSLEQIPLYQTPAGKKKRMMKFVLSNNTTYKQAHHAMPNLSKSCLNAIFYCLGNSQESESKD